MAYLPRPITDKISIDDSNDKLVYGASSMQGWRLTQDDAHNAILDYDANVSFFAMYDGHGGPEVAKYCAQRLPQFIKETQAYQNGKIKKALINGFLGFDATLVTPEAQAILNKITKNTTSDDKNEESEPGVSGNDNYENVDSPKQLEENAGEEDGKSLARASTKSEGEFLIKRTKKSIQVNTKPKRNSNKIQTFLDLREADGYDSGCTAVVALLTGCKLYVANAGDSRCIVCRNGQAIDMSIDHKPQNKSERSRIERAGGTVICGRVNGGLNTSRTIGDHVYKQNSKLSNKKQMITALPDVRKLTINPAKHKFMVLACDGIWNCMTSQEVVDFVRANINNKEKLSNICEKMFDYCLAPNSSGNGCDNMSAIIVKFCKTPCRQ